MSGSGTCMSALNAMCSVVESLAPLAVLAGDDADAVTAGAVTASVAASAASTSVRRVDRITMLLVAVCVSHGRGDAVDVRSMQDGSSVGQEHLAGHVRRAVAGEPGH